MHGGWTAIGLERKVGSADLLIIILGPTPFLTDIHELMKEPLSLLSSPAKKKSYRGTGDLVISDASSSSRQ